MGRIFEVHHLDTKNVVVHIDDNEWTCEFPIKTIGVSSCFQFNTFENKKEKLRLFGTATEITEDDDRYPLALEMYFRVFVLKHPEYVIRESHQPGGKAVFKAVDLNHVSKL